jgi:hypothetical protein
MPNTLGTIFVSLIRCLFVAPLEDVAINLNSLMLGAL